LAGKG